MWLSLSYQDKAVRQRVIPPSGQGGDTSTRARERLKRAVLEEAHIVACTLSFAGSAQFQDMTRAFDVVVVDEAAQAVEPATLIPLQKGCKQARAPACWVVGFLV